MQKLISIVTPTYNEEGNIEDLKFIYKIKDLLENIENEFK